MGDPSGHWIPSTFYYKYGFLARRNTSSSVRGWKSLHWIQWIFNPTDLCLILLSSWDVLNWLRRIGFQYLLICSTRCKRNNRHTDSFMLVYSTCCDPDNRRTEGFILPRQRSSSSTTISVVRWTPAGSQHSCYSIPVPHATLWLTVFFWTRI